MDFQCPPVNLTTNLADAASDTDIDQPPASLLLGPDGGGGGTGPMGTGASISGLGIVTRDGYNVIMFINDSELVGREKNYKRGQKALCSEVNFKINSVIFAFHSLGDLAIVGQYSILDH